MDKPKDTKSVEPKQEVKKPTAEDYLLPELESVECVLPQKEWSLAASESIESFIKDSRAIPEEKRMDYFNKCMGVFRKKYDLDTNPGTIRVLMVGGDLAGCGFARIEKPAKFLNRENDIVAFPTIKLVPELVSWADIIVWSRQHKNELKNIRDASFVSNKISVYDIDDNLHAIPKNNPAYAAYNPKTESFKNALDWMQFASVITVTRDALGEFYEKKTKTPYKVLPNGIDFEMFPDVKKEYNNDNPIRIGWAGSVTHYDDLAIASESLKNIKQTYGDQVEIVMMGYDGVLREWRIIDDKKPITRENLELVKVGNALGDTPIEFHKFVDVKDYYQKLVDLNLDIAVIPLADNTFNSVGKSNIKWLEMSAARVPSVISKNPAYAEVEHLKTGLVAKKDMDFERHLKRLIDNPKLREEIATNAYNKVKEDFSYSKLADRWANLYRSLIIKRHLGKL